MNYWRECFVNLFFITAALVGLWYAVRASIKAARELREGLHERND